MEKLSGEAKKYMLKIIVPVQNFDCKNLRLETADVVLKYRFLWNGFVVKLKARSTHDFPRVTKI